MHDRTSYKALKRVVEVNLLGLVEFETILKNNNKKIIKVSK